MRSVPLSQSSKSGACRNLRMVDREHRKRDVSIYCLAFLVRKGSVADEKEITLFFFSLIFNPIMKNTFWLKKRGGGKNGYQWFKEKV